MDLIPFESRTFGKAENPVDWEYVIVDTVLCDFSCTASRIWHRRLTLSKMICQTS